MGLFTGRLVRVVGIGLGAHEGSDGDNSPLSRG